MAIPTTPNLDPRPDVRIFFSGLMILAPSANSQSCEVFVHRSAPNHQLTIEVREKQAKGPDLIKMRHVGPLPYALSPPAFDEDPPIHGMSIAVETNPKGIRAYNGNPTTEGESLNLAINLDGEDFHNGAIGKIDMLSGRPSILLNDAVLYTADKTSSELTIDLKRNGQQIRSLEPFASLIGGNIYLDNGDSVRVKWMAQGMLEELKLNKPANGSSYEIYIVNDPLYESDALFIPAHDEFKEYYKLLPEVALQDQFRLDVKLPAGANPPRGSTKTPCMSVIIAGTP
ncbi:MAG TPA: hypothetical protein VHH35_03140 [Pyrinomonadaceae bacterium]|nr:hypothetical protein [Pyrinomonadaceae bacterium]